VRKNVSDVLFGRRIQICFHNFTITHAFRWNLLCQDIEVCFYRVRREDFKDFFSQEDGVVF
jgi:hypothetical protein